MCNRSPDEPPGPRALFFGRKELDGEHKKEKNATIGHGGIEGRGRSEARDGLFSYRPKIMTACSTTRDSTPLRLKDEFQARNAPRRTAIVLVVCYWDELSAWILILWPCSSHHSRSFYRWVEAEIEGNKQNLVCFVCRTKKNTRTDQQTHWPMPIFLLSFSTLNAEREWFSHLAPTLLHHCHHGKTPPKGNCRCLSDPKSDIAVDHFVVTPTIFFFVWYWALWRNPSVLLFIA